MEAVSKSFQIIVSDDSLQVLIGWISDTNCNDNNVPTAQVKILVILLQKSEMIQYTIANSSDVDDIPIDGRIPQIFPRRRHHVCIQLLADPFRILRRCSGLTVHNHQGICAILYAVRGTPHIGFSVRILHNTSFLWSYLLSRSSFISHFLVIILFRIRELCARP